MMRDHVNRALLISAGLLLAAGAMAQAPQAASPGHANAASQAQNAGNHGNGNGGGNGNGNGAGNGNGNANGHDHDHDHDNNATGAPGAKGDAVKPGNPDPGKDNDRGARMKAEHESERARLMAVLHAPLDDSAKAELKKHALRIAYLDRIKALATAAKDQDAVDRANKLIEKETARHDKWLTSLTATAQTNPAPNANGGAR